MPDPTEISELVRDLRECGVDMHSMHCRLYKVDLKPERCGFVLVINQAAAALAAAQAEIAKLRAIETTARRYFLGYVQDEADDPELGVPGQHEDAVALKEALGL